MSSTSELKSRELSVEVSQKSISKSKDKYKNKKQSKQGGDDKNQVKSDSQKRKKTTKNKSEDKRSKSASSSHSSSSNSSSSSSSQSDSSDSQSDKDKKTKKHHKRSKSNKKNSDQSKLSKHKKLNLTQKDFSTLAVPNQCNSLQIDNQAKNSSLNSSRQLQIPKQQQNSKSNYRNTHAAGNNINVQSLHQNSNGGLSGAGGDDGFGQGSTGDLKKFREETKFRAIITECIQPLLRTQKNQVSEQNKVNSELQHFGSRINELSVLTQKLLKENEQIPLILSRLTDLEELADLEQRKSKLHQEGVQERFKFYADKVNDLQQEIQHLDHMFEMRDKKIDNNFQLLMQFKERVNTEMRDFTSGINQKYTLIESKVRDLDLQMKSVDSFFKNNRTILDEFTNRFAKLEYQVEKKHEEVALFMDKDFLEMRQAQKKIEDQIRANSLNFNDLYQQLKITEKRVEPAFKGLSQVEDFIVKSLPFLIHLHVSDSLQEFLSIQDKFKLIQYDNKKLQEFSDYYHQRKNKFNDSEVHEEDSEGDQENQENSSTVHGEDEKSSLKPDSQMLPLFKRRLDNLMEFLLQKEKGCLRFEYGRDWWLSMNEEQIEYMDKGYSVSLDTKYQHIQRANEVIQQKEKQMQVDAEEAMRRRTQKIAEQSASSQNVSRSQSRLMLMNGGMPGGMNGVNQVIFYKELAVIRHSSKKESLQAAFNARKIKSKQIRDRNKQKKILERLMQEQDELDSDVEFSVSSSDLEQIEEDHQFLLVPGETRIPSSSFHNQKIAIHGSMIMGGIGGIGMGEQYTKIKKNHATRPISKYKKQYQKQLTEIKHLFDIEEISSKTSGDKLQLKRQKALNKAGGNQSPLKRDDESITSSLKFFFPDQIKERMQVLLQLGFRQTQKLQKKINRLVKIHKEQSKVQNETLDKGLEKIKKAKNKFTDMVDYLDQKVNEQITKYNSNVESLQVEFKDFKDNIQTEYIDFFKHRQRIRTEISVMTKETNERIDGFSNLIDRYGSNHETVNQIVPLVVESLELIMRTVMRDNEEREALNKRLRFQEAANDGYLMLENIKQATTISKVANIATIGGNNSNIVADLMSTPQQNGGFKKDYVSENIQSQSIPKESNLQNSLNKIAAHNPDIPLPELFKGSLYLKQMDYRQNELTRLQIRQILEAFLDRMNNLIESQTVMSSIQLTPKVMFDDFYLNLFGQKSSIEQDAFGKLRTRSSSKNNKIQLPQSSLSNLAAFQNNIIQGNINQRLNNESALSRQKSRNSRGSLGMSKSMGINTYTTVIPTAATQTTQTPLLRQNLQQQQINQINPNEMIDTYSSLHKLKLLERIEMKTQKLHGYQRERDSQIQDYLNKTFDEAQNSQHLLGNTHTTIGNHLNSFESFDNTGLMRHNKQKSQLNYNTGISPDQHSPVKSTTQMLQNNNPSINANHQRATTSVKDQLLKSRNAINQSFSSIGALKLGISTNHTQVSFQPSGSNTNPQNVIRPVTTQENVRRSALSQSFNRAGGGFNQNPNPTINKPQTALNQYIKRRHLNNTTLISAGIANLNSINHQAQNSDEALDQIQVIGSRNTTSTSHNFISMMRGRGDYQGGTNLVMIPQQLNISTDQRVLASNFKSNNHLNINNNSHSQNHHQGEKILKTNNDSIIKQ